MDTTVIESVEAIKKADPGDMLTKIKDLPMQIRDAWKISQAATLPPAYSDVRNITVLGMGGSALGGEFAGALLADELKVPLHVHRDYGVPGYVGRDSLVIASSFSGNTEETLSGFAEAKKRGAKLLVLTTGRNLPEEAKTLRLPLITFTSPPQPPPPMGSPLPLALA